MHDLQKEVCMVAASLFEVTNFTESHKFIIVCLDRVMSLSLVSSGS